MKKDLLTQAKEDVRKRVENRRYSLLYEFMELVPDEKLEQLITYDENSNKLFINNEEICILNSITAIYQEKNKRKDYQLNIEVIFENLDTNTGVIFATRKLTFKYECTSKGEDDWKYELEDWIENPTYRDEVETEQAKQQYESEYEYTPVLEGEMPF